MEEYTLPLSKIIEHEKLEPLHLPRDPENIIIRSRDVIRPGLELNGFYEYFDTNRVAIMGRAEMGLLNRFGEEQRTEVIEVLCTAPRGGYPSPEHPSLGRYAGGCRAVRDTAFDVRGHHLRGGCQPCGVSQC